MEFIHQPYQPEETVAAVATPPGEGGVAIIRISGKEALAVAAKIFSGPIHTYATHTAHYGQIINLQGEHVDDVLVLVMKGRRSFTGEDTVEIHCHGGSLITRRVLEVVLQAGARAALPGEFTFKAYINGKMDLAQAEAVQELICAKNERALDAAESQLKGALSQRISAFQQELTKTAAILEAWIDFPEEGLEFASMEEICQELEGTCNRMQELAATFHDGRILHDGLTVCLIGAPNAGKSSLMNALLDKDRAIVSHVAGTTRDVLEDHLRLNGLNVKLVDTAGIRFSQDEIEQEGIRRSQAAMSQADLILFVLDAHKGITQEEQWIIGQVPADKTVAIWNKIDLPHSALPKIPFAHQACISAKQKKGIESLRSIIDEVVWKKGPPSKEEVLITNIRHKEALQRSIAAIRQVIEGLQKGVSPEFLSMDMRLSLQELGKIIGTNVGEDILSSIFSTFCIGK